MLDGQRVYGDVVVYDGAGFLKGKADEMIAKDVADLLNRHYPKYLWFVHASVKSGIVTIQCGDVVSQYGYKARIRDFENDPSMKLIVRAGGEILERFRLSRNKKIDGEAETLTSIVGRTAFDYNGMIDEKSIPAGFKKMLEKARK